MTKELHLERFKRDRETKEEILVPYNLHIEDVICLYKDRNGTFIVKKQGYQNKVPYKFNELREYLGI